MLYIVVNYNKSFRYMYSDVLFVINKTDYKLPKLYLTYFISLDEDMYTKAVGGQSTKTGCYHLLHAIIFKKHVFLQACSL